MKKELGAVLEQQRNAVAMTKAGVRVRTAQALHLGARLTVRVLDALRMIGAVGRGRRAQKRVIGHD